ncbi:MAG: hypothetical protein RXO43_01160 [Candidatus Micrarchaeota archaeon]
MEDVPANTHAYEKVNHGNNDSASIEEKLKKLISLSKEVSMPGKQEILDLNYLNTGITEITNLISDKYLNSFRAKRILKLLNSLNSVYKDFEAKYNIVYLPFVVKISKSNTRGNKKVKLKVLNSAAFAFKPRDEQSVQNENQSGILPRTPEILWAEKEEYEQKVTPISAYTFTDAEGVERKAYTFELSSGKLLTIVFYPKNALPYNDGIVNNKEVIFLGREPKSRSVEATKAFFENLRKNSSGFREEAGDLLNAGKDIVVFVEIDPIQIAKLAQSLGSKSDLVNKIVDHAKLNTWMVSEEEKKVMDALIASTIINEKGDLTSERNYDAAYNVFMWLMGDKAAEAKVQEKVDKLNKIIENWEFEHRIYNTIYALNQAKLLDIENLNRVDKILSYLIESDGYLSKRYNNLKLDSSRLVDIKNALENRREECEKELIMMQAVQNTLQEEIKTMQEKIKTMQEEIKGIKGIVRVGEKREIKELDEKVQELNEEIQELNDKVYDINKEKAYIDNLIPKIDAIKTLRDWREKVSISLDNYNVSDLGNKKIYEKIKELVLNEKDLLNQLIKVMENSLSSKVKSLDDLFFVHVTQFLPTETPNGKVIVPLFDATLNANRFEKERVKIITSEDYKDYLKEFEKIGKPKIEPRNTVHGAANHTIESIPMTGYWNDMPFVIIAPLKSLIQLNRDLVSVNEEDIIFRISPGEGLKLPDETIVVRPALTPEEEQSLEKENKAFEFIDKNNVIYNPEKIKRDEVVKKVFEIKDIINISEVSMNIGELISLISAQLGVSAKRDSELIKYNHISSFLAIVEGLLKDEISPKEFEDKRAGLLNDIFSVSNDAELGKNFAALPEGWPELRTLFLGGVL